MTAQEQIVPANAYEVVVELLALRGVIDGAIRNAIQSSVDLEQIGFVYEDLVIRLHKDNVKHVFYPASLLHV